MGLVEVGGRSVVGRQVGAASADNHHPVEHSPAVALGAIQAASAEKIIERVRPRVSIVWMLI